jgi:uncharacterized protein YfaP (DUF2135 family)
MNGTDLDLHFLHPSGQWNQAPYDCYGLNANPSEGWDPRLDIDDVNGAGPENINYESPDPGVYRIGVHYHEDRAFGASYATVRVFTDRGLIYESRDFLLEGTGVFWEVASLSWPSGEVTVIDQITNGFP